MVKQYYNQRLGARPPVLSLVELTRMVASTYEQFHADEYFQEAFGYYCVDAGDVPGSAGSDIESYFYRKLFVPDLWPLKPAFERGLDEPILFALVEFLHDCVSKPVHGRYHSFSSCGWHYEQFDKLAGQERWRSEVNQYLQFYGEGFELSDAGEVQRLGRPGLRELMDETLAASAATKHSGKIAAAVRKFRLGRATLQERQDATRELADVLEYHRPLVKAHLLTKDESDLFNIANNFSIRHHNERQKTDYDGEMLTWVFHVFLATSHLMVSLNERQLKEASAEEPPF